MSESSWDRYREAERKAKNGENYRAWGGGKGDIDRSAHQALPAGFNLIKVAEQFGNDSREYAEALAAWRKAVKDNT